MYKICETQNLESMSAGWVRRGCEGGAELGAKGCEQSIRGAVKNSRALRASSELRTIKKS